MTDCASQIAKRLPPYITGSIKHPSIMRDNFCVENCFTTCMQGIFEIVKNAMSPNARANTRGSGWTIIIPITATAAAGDGRPEK